MKGMLVSTISCRQRAVVLLVTFAISSSLSLRSQTVLTPASAKPASAEEAVVLSPFTVNTDKDDGFVANSALAGGRMATDLRDTPAAYSVLTREFIDAAGIADLKGAIDWTVNSTVVTDNGTNALFGDELIVNFRGVSSNKPQRNFFPSYVNFDSYNLDRFDFARGPNSILFGNGSFGGTANVVTKQARHDKPTREVSVSAGSWSNYRVVVDDNQPLTNKLAVRTSLLWQKARSWRDRDFDNRQAAFIAGSYNINERLNLRGEAEYGEFKRLQSLEILGDNISGWDGKTTFSSLQAAAPVDANTAGVTRNGAGYYVYAPTSGVSDVVSWTGTMTTLGGNANAAVPVGGNLVTGAGTNVVGTPLNYDINLPASRLANAIAGSKFRVPANSFSYAPDAPLFDQKYKNTAVFLNYRLGDSVFAEIAGSWAKEERGINFIHRRGLSNVFIDINSNLPTGAPNPNFLVPYNEAAPYFQVRATTDKNIRGALAYVKKLSWAEFKLNALGGFFEDDYTSRLKLYTARIAADHRAWSSQDLVRFRYYWNQAGHPLSLLPSGVKLIDPNAGTSTTFSPGWVLDNSRADLGQDVQSTLKYVQAAANGSFFKGRLNLLGAVRRDSYKTAIQNTVVPGEYPVDWDGNRFIYRPDAPADYYALTYQPKDSAGNIVGAGTALAADTRPRAANGDRLQQYAKDRFKDDYNPPSIRGDIDTVSFGGVYHANRWLSAYANYAETFNPPPNGQSVTGSLFPAQTSKGYDGGIRLELFNGKLNASLGSYRGKEDNQAVQPLTAGPINAILQGAPLGAATIDARNKRGEPNVPGVYYDARGRSSKGLEFEMTANLSSSLRILFNAARAEAFQENAFPETRDWVVQKDAVLRQIVADAGVVIDAKNVASVDTNIPVANRSPSANSVAQGWNDLQTLLRNFVTGKQKIARLTELTANLFVDYTFREGAAKGLKLGAGLNYRGKQVIGFRGADTMADPTNQSVAVDDPTVDAYSVVYSDPYYLVMATAGYSWKFNKKTQVTVNLRINNLLNESKVMYYDTTQRPVNGNVSSPARVATPMDFLYQTPRSYSMACTLKF